jgi:hypothetical protein
MPTTGPYFFSTDGGQTWSMNSVIPGGTATFGTKDISVRFGGSSGVLYAGILRGDSSLRLNILRKPNFSGPGLMTILVDRLNEDQPWVQAATVLGPGGTLVDRVFVSSNDVSQRTTTGHTASVDVSEDAATAPAPAASAPTGSRRARRRRCRWAPATRTGRACARHSIAPAGSTASSSAGERSARRT